MDDRFLALRHLFVLFYFGTRIYPPFSDGRDGRILWTPQNVLVWAFGQGTPQTDCKAGTLLPHRSRYALTNL